MRGITPRIAVVGGGLAGLTAAAAIVRDGGIPVMFDAAKEPGGRARTREDRGFRFNLGPHALYPRAARTLQSLGIAIPGRSPRVAGVAVRHRRLHRLPATAWALAQTGLLTPLDKADFGRVLTGLRRANSDEWHERTISEWVGQASQRPAVRELLHALMRLATYSNAPDEFSAGAGLAQFSGATGVIYVDGGWRTLTAQLQARIVEGGGSIISSARVASIRPNGGRVELIVGGEARGFDGAVVTGSARDVVDVLGVHASPRLRRAADTATSIRASVLDLGLRALPRPRRTFGLGIDQPLYLSVHSAAARGLAPEGGATLNLARYTPVGERVDLAAVEAQLVAWAGTAQPGWRDQLESRGFFPDLQVMTGFPRATEGGLPGRPGVADSGIPGVFIAGDWVGPVGLLSDAATASGVAAGSASVAAMSNRRLAVGVA